MDKFLSDNEKTMDFEELLKVKKRYKAFMDEYVLIQYCKTLTNNINEVAPESSLLLHFFEFLSKGEMSTRNIHKLAAWVFINQNKGAFFCKTPEDMIQVLKSVDCGYNEEFFITSLCKFVVQYCELGKQNKRLKNHIESLRRKNLQNIYNIAPGLSKIVSRYWRSANKWKVTCTFFNGKLAV